MWIQEFNYYLLKTAGATGKAWKYGVFYDDDNKTMSSAFFKPYKSASNFFIRVASVVAAPTSLAIFAIELLGLAIFSAIKALVEVCMQEPDRAEESIYLTANCLLVFVPILLSAIISPIVNLVDLIGGGVASIAECCDVEELEFGSGH